MGSRTTKTWLITGASSGLGLATALEALNAGHKVIACARDPVKAASTHPEVEKRGGKWLKLDVDSPDTTKIVKGASDEVGGFDVVVNNAGYVPTGTIDDFEESEMRAAFDTMFWGPIRVLKGALPAMKARNTGTIIYNGSSFGFSPMPAGAMYCCPKAAGDMLQTVLRIELGHYDIRFVTLMAGLFRTPVLTSSKPPKNGFAESTLSGGALPVLLGQMGGMVQDPEAHIPGDPAKFAQRVVEIVDGTGFGPKVQKAHRVLMGRDAIDLASLQMEQLKKDFEASHELAGSTDYEGSTAAGISAVGDLMRG